MGGHYSSPLPAKKKEGSAYAKFGVCVCVCVGGGGGRLRDKQGVYVGNVIVANSSFIGFVPSRGLAL